MRARALLTVVAHTCFLSECMRYISFLLVGIRLVFDAKLSGTAAVLLGFSWGSEQASSGKLSQLGWPSLGRYDCIYLLKHAFGSQKGVPYEWSVRIKLIDNQKCEGSKQIFSTRMSCN